MKEYFEAAVWDKTNPKSPPGTSKRARTLSSLKVKKKDVILAPHVRYRSSDFGGTFVLADGVAETLPKKGWAVVEVYCLWFGHRLKTRGLNFKVDMSKARVERGFTGEVVFNIGN